MLFGYKQEWANQSDCTGMQMYELALGADKVGAATRSYYYSIINNPGMITSLYDDGFPENDSHITKIKLANGIYEKTATTWNEGNPGWEVTYVRDRLGRITEIHKNRKTHDTPYEYFIHYIKYKDISSNDKSINTSYDIAEITTKLFTPAASGYYFSDEEYVRFKYDLDGNVTGQTEGSAFAFDSKTKTFTYDKLGRMISTTDGSDTLNLKYDRRNNLISRSGSNYLQNTFEYSENNELRSMTLKPNGDTPVKTYYFTYDKLHNPVRYKINASSLADAETKDILQDIYAFFFLTHIRLLHSQLQKIHQCAHHRQKHPHYPDK